MDYDSDLHETRTNAEHSETADVFRVSYESPQRAKDGRLYYFEHQVQRIEDKPTDHFLDRLEMDELRALLSEMVDYTGICSHWHWPLPPAGLPGFLHSGYDKESLEGRLLELGIRYVCAVVNNERRAMHLRWEDASDFIRKIEDKAEERIYAEQARRAMSDAVRRDSEEQFVYFIGSETGPVKIGIACKPLNRLRELQTSHHEKLEILATVKGTLRTEKAYHKRYKAHRLKGEWFKRCRAIENEIRRLTSETGRG